MRAVLHLLARICIVAAVAWTSLPAAAQPAGRSPAAPDTTKPKEVEILHAEMLTGRVVDGERVQELSGNVRLRHEQTWLWADRAIDYAARDEILFLGNVLVVDERDSLAADTVLYRKDTKVGRAWGHVRLSDGDVEVFAPAGIYYTEEKRASFERGVTLVDSSGVLRSLGGLYFTEEKRAEFFGDVHLQEDRTYLRADSVTYFRETEIANARGSVVIERLGGEEEGTEAPADTLVRTLLFGSEAYNDNESGFSRMRGRPLLVQLRRDTTEHRVDTLLVRAAVLEVSREDSLDRLVAIDSVRIWQRDLAAVADSLVYDRVEVASEEAGTSETREEARLFGSPLTWFDESQVSGDSLVVRGRSGSVDSLLVRNGAFVAQRDTALGRVHQLRGRHLTAAFRDDSLRTLVLGPTAEAIYYRADDDGAPAGAIQTSADRITLYFEEGEVRKISAVRGNEGTYFPEDLLPTDLVLEGFRWLPERRPTREELLEGMTVPARLLEPGPDGERPPVAFGPAPPDPATHP